MKSLRSRSYLGWSPGKWRPLLKNCRSRLARWCLDAIKDHWLCLLCAGWSVCAPAKAGCICFHALIVTHLQFPVYVFTVQRHRCLITLVYKCWCWGFDRGKHNLIPESQQWWKDHQWNTSTLDLLKNQMGSFLLITAIFFAKKLYKWMKTRPPNCSGMDRWFIAI